jgi:hypothetical protein
MTIIILCVNWFKLVFIKLFRMTLSLNNVFFHKKGGTSVMRRNLQMDVLKEYKMVWCHNYVKYNNIQNKFSLLKLCSVVRIHFYVIRYCICIYIRYDNVTLSPLLLPARVTNRSHSTYGSSARSDSHRAVFCPNSVVVGKINGGER